MLPDLYLFRGVILRGPCRQFFGPGQRDRLADAVAIDPYGKPCLHCMLLSGLSVRPHTPTLHLAPGPVCESVHTRARTRTRTPAHARMPAPASCGRTPTTAPAPAHGRSSLLWWCGGAWGGAAKKPKRSPIGFLNCRLRSTPTKHSVSTQPRHTLTCISMRHAFPIEPFSAAPKCPTPTGWIPTFVHNG